MTRAQLAARLRAALPGWTVTEHGPWMFFGQRHPGYIVLTGPALIVVVPGERKYIQAPEEDYRPLPTGRGWPERFAADLLAAHAARGAR